MNVLGYGRPWAAGGPMDLRSEWWLRAHWGRAFEVLAFQPEGILGQDAILLRHRDVAGLSPATLEHPEPSEERELISARHAIRQLHREHAQLNSSHDAYAEAYRREAEGYRDAEVQIASSRPTFRQPELSLALLKASGPVWAGSPTELREQSGRWFPNLSA